MFAFRRVLAHVKGQHLRNLADAVDGHITQPDIAVNELLELPGTDFAESFEPGGFNPQFLFAPALELLGRRFLLLVRVAVDGLLLVAYPENRCFENIDVTEFYQRFKIVQEESEQ